MNNRPPWLGFGWLLALVVLFVVIVFWAADTPLNRDRLLVMLGALALSRLLP